MTFDPINISTMKVRSRLSSSVESWDKLVHHHITKRAADTLVFGKVIDKSITVIPACGAQAKHLDEYFLNEKYAEEILRSLFSVVTDKNAYLGGHYIDGNGTYVKNSRQERFDELCADMFEDLNPYPVYDRKPLEPVPAKKTKHVVCDSCLATIFGAKSKSFTASHVRSVCLVAIDRVLEDRDSFPAITKVWKTQKRGKKPDRKIDQIYRFVKAAGAAGRSRTEIESFGYGLAYPGLEDKIEVDDEFRQPSTVKMSRRSKGWGSVHFTRHARQGSFTRILVVGPENSSGVRKPMVRWFAGKEPPK